MCKDLHMARYPIRGPQNTKAPHMCFWGSVGFVQIIILYINSQLDATIIILLLLHLVDCLYYCINDARSHKHQINYYFFLDFLPFTL